MVSVTPIPLPGGGHAIGVTVELPRTRLVAAAVPEGYIMCGALDVALLDRLLGERHVVAGRALGVRTLDDLLAKPLESVTDAARTLGVHEGMTGLQALSRMRAAGDVPSSALAPTGSRPTFE